MFIKKCIFIVKFLLPDRKYTQVYHKPNTPNFNTLEFRPDNTTYVKDILIYIFLLKIKKFFACGKSVCLWVFLKLNKRTHNFIRYTLFIKMLLHLIYFYYNYKI